MIVSPKEPRVHIKETPVVSIRITSHIYQKTLFTIHRTFKELFKIHLNMTYVLMTIGQSVKRFCAVIEWL